MCLATKSHGSVFLYKILFNSSISRNLVKTEQANQNKEIIDKPTYKNIKPVDSRPGILYGLGKIHKETRNGLPPFCPILSAIGTPIYKLPKFLTFSTTNEHTVIDSEEIS